MCKCFIEGLNEDIKLLVGILDINEFLVLVERACKAEELSKEKKKADSKARDERKRSMSKTSQPSTKRFRDVSNRSNASFGHMSRDRPRRMLVQKFKLQLNQVSAVLKAASLSVNSVEAEEENVQNERPSNVTARGRPPRNARDVSGSQRGITDIAVRSEARALA
ncbi:Gag-Pol polyprotein [Gossypium australe]|uniref:Gag-Pol polyprotein n=1 Tax=Gossypium australe TaxID=47621 RepID=A0A5B6VAJ2_9ROSI|nr:Gag-Pol polyprotein [Gossypium australe]